MFLTSDLIAAKHGFFTREGGASTGEYASLNCGMGSGDDVELVKKNRQTISKLLHCDDILTAKQTHSDIALIVNGPGEYQCDALVTDKFGLPLGILTADCAPILLYCANSAVIGAAHAGWRGARFGIIGSTVRAMQNLGATEINAVIGPCIQKDAYEVGQDFMNIFASEGGQNGEFFTPSKNRGHYMFDLSAYVEMKLYKNGVRKVHVTNEDTHSQPNKFYSYRRSTQEGKKEYGRQLSVICL